VSRYGYNLVFDILGSTDRLTISNYFYSGAYRVERFEFLDGVVFILQDIQLGASTVDNLIGTSGDSILMGYEGEDTLNGGSGNDLINGGSGADRLIGGGGDDIFIVDDIGDIVIEEINEGIDTVFSFINYSLPLNVENLTLSGNNSINAIGNNLNNILRGNSSSNTLSGGLGDDTYYVDPFDVVFENPNEGIDTIISLGSYTLPSNVENLTLLGSENINGKGNEINNILIGNLGSNILDGSSGADILIGGVGDDVYIVDNIGDRIVEDLGEGIDTVQSLISWTLGTNLENLILIGTLGINGTGNELNNVITGNSGGNILNGGLGADILIGGAGNDTYIVDNPNDMIIENLNEGVDTIQSYIDFRLPSNVENLTLIGSGVVNGIGNELNNVIIGNSASNILIGGPGNDTLNGGAGEDRLIGGLGNDTYLVDNEGDTIIENQNEGTDTVKSYITYTLEANIENLTLMGTSAIDGTGNSLNNILTGNSGPNVLRGGPGNDTYVIGSGDTVIENPNEGTDTVQASVSYSLPSNVEHLTLTGRSNINGSGNELNNIITGNVGNNVLMGLDGSDTLRGNGGADVLDGSRGNDTLEGGTGNDVYIFGRGYGQDKIIDYDTTAGNNDKVRFNSGIEPVDLIFSNSGNNLLVQIYNSSDMLTIQNQNLNSSYQVESFELSDGRRLASSFLGQLIEAMAEFSSETQMNWAQLIENKREDVQMILSQYWQPQ